MVQSLVEVAQTLKSSNKKAQLIYAFNGSGKTRLSRTFKNLISPESDGDEIDPSRNKILYYNAFTEDLFYWDSNLVSGTTPKLKIQPNSFTDWILKDQGKEGEIVANFQYYSTDKITPVFNAAYQVTESNGEKVSVLENSEVTFRLNSSNILTDENGETIVSEDGDTLVAEQEGLVKVSKGEESNFIWSIFYAVIEQVIEVLNEPEPEQRETNQFDQLEYIFIDDPVSSLDENHLIQLAVDLAGLIKSSTSDLKFIVTTHNPLFYNVLFNEIGKARKLMLNKGEDDDYELLDQGTDSPFAYHLFLMEELQKAISSGTIRKYHFNFLRNIFEKTSTFLGYKIWQDLLPQVEGGGTNPYASRIVNISSHSKHAGEEVSELTDPEKQMVKLLVDHLTTTYRFWKKEEQNG